MLALGDGEGCTLFALLRIGVYTIYVMVEQVEEFVPTLRWRFMGELWRRL